MKITKITEKPIYLQSNISNALVNFSQHTVSLVSIHTDQLRDGKPVIGRAFNSIGRFAQSGILRDRMIPRLLDVEPDSLLQSSGKNFCPAQVLACIMRNEKPGGHGDRAHAAAALELAIWDINAKLNQEPVYRTIANHHGRLDPKSTIGVYAAGGYYYDQSSTQQLKDELQRYQDLGFNRYKIKIAGAPLPFDLQRIDSALSIVGTANNLAVDANGKLSLQEALDYAQALEPYGLMWFEEAGDPLDFALNKALIENYSHPVATGENLFSAADVRNLVAYGGMRPGLDIFQMDSGLSYGITEYVRMLEIMESKGFDRTMAFPHGGQLLALHVVAGLGLGGCELYPGIFAPLGGLGDFMTVEDGYVHMPETPGFGLEAKSELFKQFDI